jgi:hypothetical protein
VEPEPPPDPELTPVPDATDILPTTPNPDVSPAPVAPAQEVAPLLLGAHPQPAPGYRDRGTGLIIFGVAQIVLGLLTGLMIPLVVLGAFMSRLAPRGEAMRPGQYVFALTSYAFLSAALLALGIGSVRMRRWARALTLVCSWYGLITGFMVTVLLTAMLPVTMRTAMRAQQHAAGAPSAELSNGIMAVVVTLIIVFFAFFLVLVPIAFVVFYSREDVEQTCRHRDPVERWTDRTPLPVLAASVALSVGAAYFLVLSVTTPMFPFFGRYLTGLLGSAGMIALAALDGYLAVALFRLKFTAWWIAVITMAIRLVSMFVTYGWADLMQAYSKMGWSDSQLQVLNANPVIHSHIILWWSFVVMVGYFGYLLWLKRYFKTAVPPTGSESLPGTSGLLAEPRA